MAQPVALAPGEVCRAYYARFGDAGDFDTWEIGGTFALRLMRMALQRGSPVTHAEVVQVYEAVFHEPYPDYSDGAVA